jgi:glucokinase
VKAGPLGGPGDLVVDIGGTKVLAVLVRDGELIARTRLDSRGLPADVLAANVVSETRAMLVREQMSLDAALVAVPGAIEREAGVVVRASNLPFSNFPLRSVLSEGLGDVEVILEDDANCGAVGEASVGAAGAVSDLLYITLSTGIGMGSVAAGRLTVGAHGYAGELGHVTMVPRGRLCGCGRRGCLEAYASGRAIGSLGAELLASDSATLLKSSVTDPTMMTAEAVIAAAEAGDGGCLGIVGDAVAFLERAVHMVQMIADPEVVVLGGGLMGNKFFACQLLGVFQSKNSAARVGPTVRAAYLGDDSVIVGGMCLLAAARGTPLSSQFRGV